MDFWQQLAERNGPWAVFLLIVIFFLWKWALPFVQNRMDAADAALKEQITVARDALRETTTAAREARKEDQERFLRALSERDQVQAAQTQAQIAQTDVIRELMEVVRGKG